MRRLQFYTVDVLAKELGVSADWVRETVKYLGTSHVAALAGEPLYAREQCTLIRRVIREQQRDAVDAAQKGDSGRAVATT